MSYWRAADSITEEGEIHEDKEVEAGDVWDGS